jgi:hypothetical protein
MTQLIAVMAVPAEQVTILLHGVSQIGMAAVTTSPVDMADLGQLGLNQIGTMMHPVMLQG